MINEILIQSIREGLESQADPIRAAAAQTYMKSERPHYGVRVPEVRKITLNAWKDNPCDSLDHLIETVQHLWRTATYREELLAAIDLTGVKQARGQIEFLPLYAEMIVTGPGGIWLIVLRIDMRRFLTRIPLM